MPRNDTQTTCNACSIEECVVAKESKTEKKAIRRLACKMCGRNFHAYCAGYENKTEKEFIEASDLFCCQKCNNFVNIVTENITFKFRDIIQNLTEQIKTSIDNINFKCTCDCNDNRNDLINKSVSNTLSNIMNYSTANMTETIQASNEPNENCPHNINESTFNKQDSTQTLPASHFSESQRKVDCLIQPSINESTNKTPAVIDKSSHITQKQPHILYLCSIEKDLSINDIKIILNDAGICLNDIEFFEPDGLFYRKRYLRLLSNQKVKLFKFKLAFEKCELIGTWFLRDSPPKHVQRHSETNYNIRTHATNEQTKYNQASYADKIQTKQHQDGNFNHIMPKPSGLLPTPVTLATQNTRNIQNQNKNYRNLQKQNFIQNKYQTNVNNQNKHQIHVNNQNKYQTHVNNQNEFQNQYMNQDKIQNPKFKSKELVSFLEQALQWVRRS